MGIQRPDAVRVLQGDAVLVHDFSDARQAHSGEPGIPGIQERHGVAAVEAILDAAHALMEQGVFRYRRPPRLSSDKQREGLRERLDYEERSYNDLWRTIPRPAEADKSSETEDAIAERKRALNLPEATSAVVPIVLGEAERTLAAARALEDQGFLVVAIRPPTVPAGTARLRVRSVAADCASSRRRLGSPVVSSCIATIGPMRPASGSPTGQIVHGRAAPAKGSVGR